MPAALASCVFSQHECVQSQMTDAAKLTSEAMSTAAPAATSPAEAPISPQGSLEVKKGGHSAVASVEVRTTAEANTALPPVPHPSNSALLAQPPNTTESLGNAASLSPADANTHVQGDMDPNLKPGSKAVGVWVVHPMDMRLEWPAYPDERKLGSGGTAVVLRSVPAACC